MTADDLTAVHAILNLNLDDYFAPEVVAFFLAQWPEAQFVSVSVTGRVTGALCAARLGGNRATVSLLAVDAPARGQGAGGQLLEALRRVCLMEGVSFMQLEVRASNVSARRFYEKRGFAVAESLPRYYNDGGDGYRMVCPVFGNRINPS